MYAIIGILPGMICLYNRDIILYDYFLKIERTQQQTISIHVIILINGKIDGKSFEVTINDTFQNKHKCNDAKIKVIGEPVAILWGQGIRKTTINPEKFRHNLCKTGVISLVCAYPKEGFMQEINH